MATSPNPSGAWLRIAAASRAEGPVGYGVFGFRAAVAATARGDVVDAGGGAEEFERVGWCENAHIETRAAAHDHAVRAELNGLAECVIALQSHRDRSSSLSATPCGWEVGRQEVNYRFALSFIEDEVTVSHPFRDSAAQCPPRN